MDKRMEFIIKWSADDKEWVGLCAQFPWLSWLDEDHTKAFTGICKLVDEIKL